MCRHLVHLVPIILLSLISGALNMVKASDKDPSSAFSASEALQGVQHLAKLEVSDIGVAIFNAIGHLKMIAMKE